jgi:TctA family transporter
MRQSLIMSHGSMTVFLERPISGVITVAAIALLVAPLFKYLRRRPAQTARS